MRRIVLSSFRLSIISIMFTHAGWAACPDCDNGKAFRAEMRSAMTTMDKDMGGAPMTGDPDRDFLAAMVPHHQGAIDMARAVLAHGKDPIARRLAEEIAATQQA